MFFSPYFSKRKLLEKVLMSAQDSCHEAQLAEIHYICIYLPVNINLSSLLT